MLSDTDSAASDLDELPQLPRRNLASIGLVLGVQTLNAFNDNFVKMLFISLASAVAAGTELGRAMQVYLGFIFSLPYILFAPLAGYLSDRYSKRSVVLWMQVAQVAVFVTFVVVLLLRSPQWSLLLSLAGFFLLATEAALFSPAKMGVIKELSGSRRLGIYSGWLQMTLMAGVLSGMWAGGTMFGSLEKSSGDPWHAALVLSAVVTGFALLQTLGAAGIQKTPPHPEVEFRTAMLWEHFAHLRLLFRDRLIRQAALGISFFWLVSNSILTILVTMASEAHPTDASEASKVRSLMAAVLGLGIVLGSMFASWVCKRRIELGLVPLAGLGMSAALLWTGLLPVTSQHIYTSLTLLGFAGGCFMVPLYAFVQDRAAPAERARILSGVNLMDCLAALVAMGLVWSYLQLHLSSSIQVLTLVLPCIVASLLLLKLVPEQFARLICLAILRFAYRLKATGTQNIPRTGGVLILANHSSYMDALLLSVPFERPVRFVMWDTLYHTGWMNGFLRLFDTVPISPTRAKEAVRTVVQALKDGHAVCLFPEGQLTRSGAMNEIRRGFELMVRQADVPVVPAYLDGLWGSIFSFKDGRFFSKRPRLARPSVRVRFGELIPAAEANATRIREAMLAAGSEAFLSRPALKRASDPQALANMLRIAHVELLVKGGTLLVLGGASSVTGRCLMLLKNVRVVFSTAEAATAAEGTVVAVGTAAELASLSTWSDWPRLGRLALCWQGEAPVALPDLGAVPVLRGWLHEATGALISTEIPDPIKPEGPDVMEQLGRRPGTLGRLLPGLAAHEDATGLRITGLAPGDQHGVLLPGGRLDEAGFVVPASPPPQAAP